jgi:uncharacterized membrane protein YfhO
MKLISKLDKYIILLFLIVTVMCYFIFYRIPENGYFYISKLGDIKEQYIHFFNLYHSLVRSGELPFWTWQLGPGGSFWNQFGYYILGDIFIWPMLLLPKNLFPYSFIPISTLKIFLMALGMYLFLRKFGIKKNIALFSGISYSFATLYFENLYTHYFFVNPAVFFPFLLWGYEKYLSDKKVLPFMFVFFICAISNFYFLFMLTIGLFFYIIFRFFTQEYIERNIKVFWNFHWRLAVLYLLSLGIAMVIFLPSVIAFFESNAIVRPEKPFFEATLSLGDAVRKLLWSGGIHFLPFITIPLLLANGKRNLMYGLMGLIISLMLIFQKINSIIGGFSLPSEFRSFFVFNAFFIILSAIALNDIDFRKKKNIIGLFILSFIISFWFYRNPFTHYGEYFKLLPLLFAFSFCLFINLEKVYYKLVAYTISLCIICVYSFAAPYSFVSDLITKSNGNDPGNLHKGVWGTLPLMSKSDFISFYENKDVQNALQFIDNDKSLYRIYMNAPGITTHNSSMSYGYRSFYAYNSLLQWNLQRFEMDDLGQLGSRSLSMLRGYPNSTVLNTLLSNKYNISFTGKASNLYGYEMITKQGDLVIEKNKNWLPIGFLYDHMMAVKDYKKTGFENQDEVLLRNAVVPNNISKKYKMQPDNLITSTLLSNMSTSKIENADSIRTTSEGIMVKSTSKPIVITLPLKEHKLGEIFVFGDIIPYTSTKGKTVNLSTDRGLSYYLEKNMVSNQYINTQYQYRNTTDKVLFRLGKDEKSKWVKLVIQPGEFLIKNLKVTLNDYNTYNLLADKYQKDSLTKIKYGNNYVSGDVDAKKESVLFLSIPYSKGWAAYIDNKRVETFSTQLAYTGVFIPKGKHEIRLKYKPEGFKTGIIISLFSILLLFIYHKKIIGFVVKHPR